jgi:hypothetical protein
MRNIEPSIRTYLPNTLFIKSLQELRYLIPGGRIPLVLQLLSKLLGQEDIRYVSNQRQSLVNEFGTVLKIKDAYKLPRRGSGQRQRTILDSD